MGGSTVVLGAGLKFTTFCLKGREFLLTRTTVAGTIVSWLGPYNIILKLKIKINEAL